MKKILKSVYNSIPFKRDVFSFIKLFNPSHRIYQHLHFKGEFSIIGTETIRTIKMVHHGFEIENELFWKGINGYEPVSMGLWIKLCYQSKEIFDVGANTGIFSLVAGASKNNPIVYAFEPVKRIYEKMVKNVSLNDFNIYPFEYAISNQDGTAVFYDTDDEHNYSATLNLNNKKGRTVETKVTTMTLDTFIENNKAIPDLVKIDVERFEPEVIEGFMKTIRAHMPTILIELLDDDIAERVEALIKDVPYKYFSIDEKSGIREVKRLSKSDSFNFLICSEEVARRINL